ncbi:hypothetical protein GIB67_031740 [Kingdonia uniflora]|uniref:Sugar phosphate transporter domain-containing protein n=1 Tax=Kingdonia uniflora TaxID=39325 RepID=A0A7J7NJY3_9MAGN|nr:hypothetical protein GIB67_031740 [Kingdonia uniflora]
MDNITLFSLIIIMSLFILTPVALSMEGVKFTPTYLQVAGLNAKDVCIKALVAGICFHAYQQDETKEYVARSNYSDIEVKGKRVSHIENKSKSMARNMSSSQLSDLGLLATFGDDVFTIMMDVTILAWDKRQDTFLWTCNANNKIISVVTSKKAWVKIETGSMLKRLGSNGDGDQFCCDEFVADKISIGIERLEKIPIILQKFGMAESLVREITERAQRKNKMLHRVVKAVLGRFGSFSS